jgi:chaperonin cofactor prefoldin/chemotaxis signal transduction protein
LKKFALNLIEKVVPIAAAKDSSGQIGITDNIRLVLELDRLSQRLTRTVHDRQFSLTAIDVRQSEVARRIEEGIKAGKLTDSEAAELKAEFKRINDRQDQLRHLARPLTAEEQLTIALDIEKLSGQVDTQVYDSEVVSQKSDSSRVPQRESEVDRDIANALSTGLITLTEAQVYKQQLDRVIAKEKNFRVLAGGELDALQAQNLLVELEQLSGSLDRSTFEKKPVWPGVHGTIADIKKSIDEAKAANRLDPSDEDSLTKEIAAIDAKRLNGGATVQSTMEIVVALNQVSSKLTRSVKDRNIAYIPDLDKRKAEINKRIADGVVSGKLTLDEGNTAIAEFNRIGALQNTYKAVDGVIDEREKLTLALELERLSTRVEKDIRDNQFAAKPVQVLKEDADRTIASGTLSGKLSAQEVQALRAELIRINTFESSKIASQGKLEAQDAILIVLDLNKLIRDTENSSKNAEVALPDIAKREAELYQRITEGVMQGRLTVKDSDSLKKDFYRILDQESKYRASGGLSFGEHAALSLELERLANSIESNMGDTQAAVPDVDARQAELDKKIATAVASGQLTMAQTQEFTKELDRINRDEITYRFSGTGLSYAESISLVADLEKLNGRIDTQIAGQTAKWSGIDGRVESIAKQIGQALLSQKINGATASQLKREVDRVAQAKIAFETSGGGLNLAETESLVRDLDRLTRSLDIRQGVGQVVAWTDIDGRQARAEARIAQDTAQGKLSASKASKAKKQLQIFKLVKASMKGSAGGNFTYSQIVVMAQTLDKIDSLVGIAPVAAPSRNQ